MPEPDPSPTRNTASREAWQHLVVGVSVTAFGLPWALGWLWPGLSGGAATGIGAVCTWLLLWHLLLRRRPGGLDAAMAQAGAVDAERDVGWRRMRWTVYATFAVLAANAVAQAWQAHRLEASRLVDTEIVEIAGQQGRLTQSVGRLAALMLADPARAAQWVPALADELDRSRDQALRAQSHLAELLNRGDAQSRMLGDTVERWHAARERLWYRAENLVRQASDGTPDGVVALAQAVQRESGGAEVAAQTLLAELARQARSQQRSGVTMAALGVVLTLLLLGLLALGVVRPSLRAAQGQSRRLAEKVRENERLALVAEHTGMAVIITDTEGRVVWTNEAFTRLTGYAFHEVVGRRADALLQSERSDRDTVERIRVALDAGQGIRAELVHRSKDGRDYWIDTDIQPLLDQDGRPGGFLAVQTDITARVTERLRIAAVFATLPTGVVVHAVDGTVVEANPAARELLGLGDPAREAAGRWHDDLRPMAADETAVAVTLAKGEGQRDQLMGVVGPDNQRRWLLSHTRPLQDALGAPAGAVACYVDMTERRRLMDQLRQSARTDGLTQLPNRAVVLERVQRAIEHRRRHPGYGFAVLFMDIDRFKQVNDTLGHSAGDELLRQVAQRLEQTLRPGDAVGRVESDLQTAARLGGDEFVIVLEGLRSADDACVVAQRLLDDLSQPYTVVAHPVHVGLSIGIVGADHAADSAEAVLRDCDIAMYEAKRAGRARYAVFDTSMHERVVGALAVEHDLRRALQADELFAVYQPVIDLVSGALAGVEALVRWQHPQRGVVPPGQFIAVAEESGLIDAVGAVVLRKACAQFAAWSGEFGHAAPPRVSVNLSRAQLQLPGLVPEVRDLLRHHGMLPHQLQLEVTESLAAQDLQVQATLRELKALGVSLALDDFGTGYSSLACLHQLPVDTVKIDRSFVAHARDVEYHRVLIEATIRVARTLGMTTVAEGIELDTQAELMQDLRCDLGQGYLYGRPMPAAQLGAWLEAQRADTVT